MFTIPFDLEEAMKVVVFSDVHGNLSALRAVLDDIEQNHNVDLTIFAGDLCLFGPRPQACLDLIRSRNLDNIVGNTDEWVRLPPPLPDKLSGRQRLWRQFVRETCRWTADRLDSLSLDWLGALSDQFERRISPTGDPADDLLIVHANPLDLGRFIFPSEQRQIELYGRTRQPDEDLEPLLGNIVAHTIAFGHIHVPAIRRWRDLTLVNVSSVSMPGDSDPRGKYVIFTWLDGTGWSVRHVTVSYPIENEIQAFRQFKPPSWQASIEQLETLGYVPQIV
jgi:predicted phosphodiesterase